MQSLRLEEFFEEGLVAPDPAAEPAWDRAAQEQFEAGYQAGWEASATARDLEAEETAAGITNALQTLEFTFHDARGHVLRSLAPLFAEVVARLLPKIAMESLPHLITEVLLPLAEQASEAPVELLVHPSMQEAVARHLATLPTVPVVLIEEPDQPPTRLALRLGERETRIDMQAALATIDHLLSRCFAPPSQDVRHG